MAHALAEERHGRCNGYNDRSREQGCRQQPRGSAAAEVHNREI